MAVATRRRSPRPPRRAGARSMSWTVVMDPGVEKTATSRASIDCRSAGALLPLRGSGSPSLGALVASVTSAGPCRPGFGSDDPRGFAEDLCLRADVGRRKERGSHTRDEMLSDGCGQVAPTPRAEMARGSKEVVELTRLERDTTPSAVGDRMVPAGLKQERALARRQHAFNVAPRAWPVNLNRLF